MTKQKKTSSNLWGDTFFESVKGIGSGVVSGVKSDFGKGVAKGVGKGLGSFVGGWGGEALDRVERPWMTERREKTPQQRGKERRKEFTVFTYQEYARHQESEQKMMAVREEIETIIKELEALGHDVSEAEKAVAMETREPGKYHVSFFERIRQILKLFRKQISESRSWLEMTYTKKKARRYWNMYKKKGTSFGLSNERTVATQAG